MLKRALRSIGLIALIAAAHASAATTGYDLSWHTVDGGGGMWSTGGAYELGGTIGQPDAGRLGGAGYLVNGGFWQEAEVVTDLYPPGYQPLGPITLTSIQTTWTANGNPPGTLYRVECWLGSGFEGVGTKLDETSYAADLFSHEFTPLSINTQYTFRARAKAAPPGADESDWTILDTAYTLAAQPAEEPLGPVAATSVQANWGANSNPGHTEYFVECYEGPTFDPPNRVGDSDWIADAQFEFTGLTPNTLYSFQVQARNGDEVTTAWTTLGSGGVHTHAAVPGALLCDMQVMDGPALNLTGPGPRSLTVEAIALNGNPPGTPIAIQIGNDPNSGWLEIIHSGPPDDRDDLFPTAATAQWHTAAEWAGKRLRGLSPEMTCVFHAKARNAADQETALAEVGTFATSVDCDANRSGLATALDYAYIRMAILTGATIGLNQPWPCDANDDGRVDIRDLAAARFRILNP